MFEGITPPFAAVLHKTERAFQDGHRARGNEWGLCVAPFLPRADIIHDVVEILLLARDRKGVEDLGGRAEVERVVAGHVVVLLEVLDHLLVGILVVHDLLAVARRQQLRDL